MIKLMSRDQGLISVGAYGLYGKNPLKACLEPFTTAQLTLEKTPRGYVRIKEGEIVRREETLATNPFRLTAAKHLAELYQIFLEEKNRDDELYDLLVLGLQEIGTSADLLASLAILRYRFLVLMGYAPALDFCARCAQSLAETRVETSAQPLAETRAVISAQPKDGTRDQSGDQSRDEEERPAGMHTQALVFEYSHGGLLCPSCARMARLEPSFVGTLVSPAGIALLRHVEACPLPQLFQIKLSPSLTTRMVNIADRWLHMRNDRDYPAYEYLLELTTFAKDLGGDKDKK